MNPQSKYFLVHNKCLSIHGQPNTNFQVASDLRVLLTKWPDILEPTFLVQWLVGCIIKSTYLGDVPKAKSWDLGAQTGL